MDKIDFNDEEVFEKFKDFFDEDDIDEKQAQKIYKGLTEEEKEENRLDYCAGSRGSHCGLFRSDQRNCQEYAHAGEYH